MIYMKDNNELNSVMEIINSEGLDGLSQAVEIILNEAMKVERSQHLKAVPYERTEDRVGYANGFKPKQIKSRVGQLNVNVPQVRESDKTPLWDEITLPMTLIRSIYKNRIIILKCS